MGGGLPLVQQLQAMIIKVCTDVKRIRDQLEDDNLHPQRIFEVVDDGLRNFIVKKKNRKETIFAMSFQRKRTPECFRWVDFHCPMTKYIAEVMR